jgi:DMSO reductase family type II enzyme chaperone
MNEDESNNNQEVTEINSAYCRAALYSAVALGFHPPTAQVLSRLLTPGSRSCLASAATLLYPREPELMAAIEALPSAEQTSELAVASQYRSLFGHTARGQITPYETEYGNEALFQQPQELGDLMGFYRAFGLTLKREHHERPDHVSCECEFLMILALKEAFALEHDNREMLGETRKAEKLFLRDHLGRFLPTLVARLGREDPSGFYSRLGDLGLRFVSAECARFQVNPGAANLGLRPVDDNRIPMACGNGAECAALPGADMPEGGDSV